MKPFAAWLAEVLDQEPCEVEKLLKSDRAVHILMAWSLFESRCSSQVSRDQPNGGLIGAKTLQPLVEWMATDCGFDPARINAAVRYVYDRYQNERRFLHLVHRRRLGDIDSGAQRFRALLLVRFEKLTASDQLYLVLFTAYRYRNNIFHGNKGVSSWLQYDEQIEICTTVLQEFLTHIESLQRTLALTRES